MRKRILSIWLAVCMVLTMFPISAMAEEVDSSIVMSGEIIAFAPLAKTEISVSTGTAIEDLGLPESLTVTVRTAVTADAGTSEEAVQDSGNPSDLAEATPGSATPTDSNGQTETNEMTEPEWNVTTPDIPVTWTSAYDMDTEGIYVFTPVIEDYFVSAALPEITVTVGTAKLQTQRTAFGALDTFSVAINTMLDIEVLPIYGDPDVDMMGNPRHSFTQPTDGSKSADLYWDAGSRLKVEYDTNSAMTVGAGSTIYFYAEESGTYTFTATFTGDNDIPHDYPITVTVTDGSAPASNPTKSIADSNLYFKDNSGDTQYSTDNTTWTSYTGEFTITGSSTSDAAATHTVIVQSGTHNITLSDCSIGAATATGIYNQASPSPFDIQSGTVNLTLTGENKLYSINEGKAALHVNPSASLVVTAESTGSLDARCHKNNANYGRGAGIGGDNTQASGTISINGGEVSAYSFNGAGIGNGNKYTYGEFGDIRITGGTVVAQSDNGNGIGFGNLNSGTGGSVTITGGSVNTSSKTSPIGGTLKNDNDIPVQLYTLTLLGVSAPTAVAALSTTPELDYVYGTSGMKTDGDGRLYVYLPTEKTAVSVTAGGVTYSGSMTSYAATLTPAVPEEPTYGAFTVTGNDLSGVNYDSGVLTVSPNAVVTIAQTGGVATPTTDRIEVISAANITLDGVNIDVSGTENAAALKITDTAGEVNLTIADGSVNTLKSGNYCAGLQKDTTAAGTMLTITGTGTLNATGGSRGAGIGGTAAATGGGTAGSYITVSGGTVTATGGYLAAGIGGGGDKSGSTTNYGGGSGSYITISGGTVTANGGYWSAGIGGGSGHNYQAGGSGSHITISGGTVTATGGSAAAGIGAGTGKWGGATDNIIISGGSIQTTSIWCTPTNGQAANVYKTTLTVPSDTTGGTDVSTMIFTSGGNTYTYNMSGAKSILDSTDNKGKVYVYLPGDDTGIAATASYDGKNYTATVKNDNNAVFVVPEAQWGVANGSAAPSSWAGSGTLDDAMTYANSNSGAYIQLLKDIGSSNHSSPWPLTFEAGKTTILDLNGKDINRGLTGAAANGNVITVNGNLTVKDSSETDVSKQGCITGGYSDNTDTGGGVYVSGSFTMQGGNITGNKTTGWGGGVRVQYGVGASFIMRGGSITSNDASNEGAVYAAGATFEMTGGSITGNKCPNNGRGAINVGSTGTFTVGGTAVISDNIAGESTVRNVRVYSDSPIRISTDMPLTSGAYIGVTANSVPTSGSPVNVTGTNSADYSSYFHSDNSSYMIQNGADNKVQLAVPVPAIGTLAISNVFTAGNSLTLTALDSYKPTITTNGVTITAQGWQQHNPNSGGYWETLSGGIIPDTGSTFTLRYYATYSGGTVYSNEVTLNVVGNTTSLALMASPESPQNTGTSITLTATLTGFFAGPGVNGQTITFKNGGTTLGTANLNAAGVAAYTWTPVTGTYSLTAEYAATAYNKSVTSSAVSYTVIVDPNIATVAAAKTALADGTVNVAFGASQADKTAAVQAYVNGLLTGAAAGVTANVTYNSETNKYDVSISKGSVNDTKSLSMTVNVAPDPDIAIVAGAKTDAQGASYSNMTQVAATDEETIKAALKNTAVTAVNNSDITITINNVAYTTPIAGTSANSSGTNGSYTFTVTVSKGTQSETTTRTTITITATPYTGITDAQAVTEAKTALVDGSVNVAFGALQADKTAAVQAYVNGLLTGDAAGATATVTYNSSTGKYDVAISKGSVNDNKSLSMTVNVAPDPDIAIAATARTAAQNASYANMIQTAAPGEDAIKTALKNTAVTAVNNSDITVTINKVSYTAPIAGTSANPSGTNGSYTFTVTVSKGTQSETTEQKTITITATDYMGGTGGGGSNGGGSTTPPSTKPTEPVTGSTENKATVDNKGNASVSLTDKNIADAMADAKAEAAKKGVNAGDITAVIHVTTGGKNADTVTVNLPKTTQEQVISNKIASVQLVIDRPDLTIGIDLAAVTEINRQAKADVQLSATRMDNTKLSGDAKAAIGSRPAYDLKALYGSGKSVTDFGKGSVSVEIPYTLQKDEIAGNVYAVYVDAKGKVIYLTDSSYDAKRGTVVFSTGHFSTYGIAYKASFNFTDIAGHWAKDDILFVANRGLMTGTSATTFSPNGSMTRGMFVTALGRLANADISAYKQSSFTDVKADAYYMGYIEWGVKNNILVGIGGGKFDPDGLVTREQMAAIMDRYATAIGFKLPEVHAQNIFADNAKIGAWAALSVKRIQMAGIIQGKNNNFYDPQGTATRAEVSAVLRRFVELTVFSDTAQGWVKNDSGQWMFFKNGKALTGWQTIDGKVYCFDSIGGAFASGWKQNAKNEWLFLSSDGSAVTGWKDIKSKGNTQRYCFDPYGIMVSGKWLQIDGKWYYFNTDGSLARSTEIDEYEVDANGVRKAQ